MTTISAMKTNMMHHIQRKEGVTLLVALLLVGVLLGISTSLLNVTLKQYQLAGIAYSSEIAFQAANAGMECALYHDFPKTGTSTFAVPGNGNEQPAQPTLTCMNSMTTSVVGLNNSPYTGDGDGLSVNGEEQYFQFNWGTSPGVCVDVSVYKYYSTSANVTRWVHGVDLGNGDDCPAHSECTIVQSRGYNVPCAEISSGAKVVEREYTLVY
jgi:hypothetical protein